MPSWPPAAGRWWAMVGRYDTGVRINKCPRCGGKIEVSYLYQYSHDYKLTKSGKLSKRYTKRDCGPMEVAVVGCRSCGADWGEEEFEIDREGYFVDYKYSEGGRS